MCYKIKIEPRDVLFFRDARPISGASIGLGATWPSPSVFHSAVISAFYRAFPNEATKRSEKLTAFSNVKTFGPFPMKDGEVLFPTPADLITDGSDDEKTVLRQLLPTEVSENLKKLGNLPSPLEFPLWAKVKPTKARPGEWISASGLEKYLSGKIDEIDCGKELFKNADIFDSEARPGIAIEAKTGTTKDGAFYMATYMRLKKGVSMVASVDVASKKQGEPDFWKKLTESNEDARIVFGGQRGVVQMSEHCEKILQDKGDCPAGKLVKWTLLSPACFHAGWRPGFVDDSGNVLLKEMPARERGESREDWRKRCKNGAGIKARLVAARIPKPVVVSGWKLGDANSGDIDAGGAPKATKLLVPAGAVFYFECESEDDAARLYRSLHGRVKSDVLGEKGFGLGVCSAWKKNAENFDTL